MWFLCRQNIVGSYFFIHLASPYNLVHLHSRLLSMDQSILLLFCSFSSNYFDYSLFFYFFLIYLYGLIIYFIDTVWIFSISLFCIYFSSGIHLLSWWWLAFFWI
jgi:hypothetical protein